MAEIKPRFEFRTFANNVGIVEEKMRKLSKVENIRESSEIYIMSAGNNENNAKIRDNLMDIKVFVKEEKGLEQWNPRMKGSFPMKSSMIKSEVFSAFGVELPEFKRDEYTLEQFLNEIVNVHNDLTAVKVFKRRFAFTINNCIAEIGEIYINGALIRTANIESVDINDILEAKKIVSLEEYENINYLMAIKRVIGMEPLPDDFYLK
ncbi:MAG: hypothetical protein ABFR75_10765 [Acidobacteriota bacterium]